MVDLSLVKPNDFWYIVGLIATDGNLSPSGRHIVITSKDRGFLYSVRRALHLQTTLGRKANGYRKEKIYSVLQFSDVKLYKLLEKIGLTKRKSLTIGPLKIPSVYFVDFLRGVIDGDGNIQTWRHASNGNMQWSVRVVSGSPRFLPWLKEKISAQIGVEGRLHKSTPQEGKIFYTL